MDSVIMEDSSALPIGYGVFRPGLLSISPERMLRVHGYKNTENLRPAIRMAAEATARWAEQLIAPQVHYRRIGVRTLTGGELVLDDGVTFHNEAFPRHLGEAREVVIAIATMGPALDREVIARMERFEPLEALFLETGGWLGIESVSKQFGDFLRALARGQGYRVSCRMGPGYTYKVGSRETQWGLEEQRQVFQVFDGIDLPVRLLESCAMLPKMSRTGLFGLVPRTRRKGLFRIGINGSAPAA